MEAGSVYDEAVARGNSEEEAGQAAADVFKKNVGVIGGPNVLEYALMFAPPFPPDTGTIAERVLEYALMFAPLPQPVKTALKGAGKLAKPISAAGRIGATGAMEGGQEAAQEYIQMGALGDPIDRDRIAESFGIGALMGAGMGVPGAIADIRGKQAEPQLAPEQLQQRYAQTWQDINQAYGNALKEQASSPIQDLAEAFGQAPRQTIAAAPVPADIPSVPSLMLGTGDAVSKGFMGRMAPRAEEIPEDLSFLGLGTKPTEPLEPDQSTRLLGEAATKEPVVMDEETYLSLNGAGRQGIGDPVMHKNIGHGGAQEELIKHQSLKDQELLAKREQLRQEYRNKVQAGELEPPTIMEERILIANGHPDNPSVQAARRSLAKRGIDWQSAKVADNSEMQAEQLRLRTRQRQGWRIRMTLGSMKGLGSRGNFLG